MLTQSRVEIEQTGRQVIFKVHRGLSVWDLPVIYEMRGLAEQSRMLDVIGEDNDRVEANFSGRVTRGTLKPDNQADTPDYPIELTPVRN